MATPAEPPVYLDYNATTPLHPEVREAMLPWLGERWGNPSSAHPFGRAAAAAIAAARAEVAALIGAPPESIVFTRGGTEADNLALFGAVTGPGRLLISTIEHPAVTAPAAVHEGAGWRVDRAPVADDGRIAVATLEALAAAGPPIDLASVIAAQNETGAIQPVAAIVGALRRASPGVIVHSDAAQAVGKIAVDVGELGVDLMTVVSHKLYGPAGIGALYVRPGLDLQPRIFGGGQERGLSPGTEPVAAIVGFGAAAALARRTLQVEATRQTGLRELLWRRLAAAIPGLRRTIPGEHALPNTLHVCLPGVRGAQVLAAAPAIAASVGSACHSDADTGPDPADRADRADRGVLGAMGIPAAVAAGALRLSLGRFTDEAAILRAADAIAGAWREVVADR